MLFIPPTLLSKPCSIFLSNSCPFLRFPLILLVPNGRFPCLPCRQKTVTWSQKDLNLYFITLFIVIFHLWVWFFLCPSHPLDNELHKSKNCVSVFCPSVQLREERVGHSTFLTCLEAGVRKAPGAQVWPFASTPREVIKGKSLRIKESGFTVWRAF